jgi:hypothetical protein
MQGRFRKHDLPELQGTRDDAGDMPPKRMRRWRAVYDLLESGSACRVEQMNRRLVKCRRTASGILRDSSSRLYLSFFGQERRPVGQGLRYTTRVDQQMAQKVHGERPVVFDIESKTAD